MSSSKLNYLTKQLEREEGKEGGREGEAEMSS